MITFVFVASFLFSWWSFAKKRKLRQLGNSDTLSGRLIANMFQWSASLFAVLLFYHVLLFALSSGWKTLTVVQLIQLEHFFRQAKDLSEAYKPSAIGTTFVLFGLYLLARVWIRFLEREIPFHFIKKITGVLKMAASALFLLASFTLLGFQPGEPAATLAIHIQKEREEYGLLRAELADSLQAPVFNQITSKITNTIPRGAEIPSLIQTTVNEGERLRAAYAHAQASTKYHSARISALMKRSEEQARVLAGAQSTAPSTRSIPRRSERAELPKDITYEQISQARSSLSRFKQSFNDHLLRFVQQPGGKELVLSLPEAAADHFGEALDPLTGQFPLLKPLVEIMKSLTSDAIEKQIESRLDSLVEHLAKNPGAVGNELQQHAQQVADSVSIQVKSKALNDLTVQLRSAKHHIAELQAISRRLDKFAQLSNARRLLLANSRPDYYQNSEGVALSRRARAIDEIHSARPVEAELSASLHGSAHTSRLQRGLERGWIVTENPATGKIFVHASSSGVMLSDLRYLIKQSADGNAWTIYLPSVAYDGSTTYGQRVGVIDRPLNVSVGQCSCQ